MPNDPTDPTIKVFTDSSNAEITKLKERRLGIQGLINVTAAGDTATQATIMAGLQPLIALDAGTFYTGLAAQVAAANIEVAAALAKGVDPTQGPAMAKLEADAATEIANVIVRRTTIQTIRDTTLAGDQGSANVALASLQQKSRADANPFYVQLPTLQANAVAIVAEPAVAVVAGS